MAVVTIRRPDLYPSTTVVNAYVLTSPRPGELEKRNSGDPEAWKAALVKKAKATAGTEKLEYTIGAGAEEVPEATPLILWANVGGEDRYLHVRVSTGNASEIS